jgi:hypothetical protein
MLDEHTWGREGGDLNVLGGLGTQPFQRVSLLSYFLRVDLRTSVARIGADAAILVGWVWVTEQVRGVGLDGGRE